MIPINKLLPNDIIIYIMSYDNNAYTKEKYKQCMHEMNCYFNNVRLRHRIQFEINLYEVYCGYKRTVIKPRCCYISPKIQCFSDYFLNRINRWKDNVLPENLPHLQIKKDLFSFSKIVVSKK